MYDRDVTNFPFAKTCDIFNIFPDLNDGPLQYVTERFVGSQELFLTTFGSLINNDNNESPFKDLVQELMNNTEKANFENLTADYNNLKEENKELIQSFDALEEKYEELENTLTLTNAQHEVDITNIQNSYETQIQANNQSHAKAIQALEDKLNEQELYYERELSSKDAIIEEQRLEIPAIS